MSTDEFEKYETKPLDLKAAIAIALMVPAFAWWSAMAMTLLQLLGFGRFLGSNRVQLVMLAACPLAAVLICLSPMRHRNLRWVIAVAGIGLASLAFLVSLRSW